MGLTSLSRERVLRTIIWKSQKEGQTISSVIELGSQNFYSKNGTLEGYADKFYKGKLNMSYTCIDINGENNAMKLDLEKPIKHYEKYDLVTDFGTSEHIRSLYQCCANIYSLCKVGGMIICENPKIGNWPGHGYNYRTSRFYEQLAKEMDYEIIELGEEAAMGNYKDGWLIFCVLKKLSDKPFVNKTKFNKFDFKYLKNQK